VPLEVAVEDVFEDDQGEVWHRVNKVIPPGVDVSGLINIERRQDHMQQHTGQHLLSAAFVQLLGAKTVSFHLGDQISTIDLEIPALSRDDLLQAERLSNEIIAENRPIAIRYATRKEAQNMGVRKLPEREGDIRLIDIQDFDLNACGGTHARSTGQIGGLMLRRTEKVKQGVRVEFVCGIRAVQAARRDFETLSETAALYPCAPADLPGNVAKQREELRQAQKRESHLLEELADFKAAELLRNGANDSAGRKWIVEVFDDRGAAFIKLLAQKATRTASAIVLLASAQDPVSVVFARSSNLQADVGTLLRELVTAAGGRGGGGKDFAQGGIPNRGDLSKLLESARSRLSAS
jgi:alanyl-tRNA synthetase